MRSIVQVEYRPSLLAVREEILATLGHPVISALGSQAARRLNPTPPSPGVIVIGHGAERRERERLIEFFRRTVFRLWCSYVNEMSDLTKRTKTAQPTTRLSG
jgi:hypothetical protein